MRFTDELRAACSEQWDRVVRHRFTDEVASGTIDRSVLGRYLVQDHRFLDSFVVLLASIVAGARSLEDRIPACQFLAVVTGKENTYFERCFAKLGGGCATPEGRALVPDAPCTERFCRLMRDVASRGTLGEMLSVMVVCEWSYLSWAQRVLDRTVRDDFVTYEWVDLHSGSFFEEVVSYLRGLLDREGQTMSEEDRRACHQRFQQAVQLEEEFFDNAYSNRGSL
jgi:thiaminase/transcriptional activator TenA